MAGSASALTACHPGQASTTKGDQQPARGRPHAAPALGPDPDESQKREDNGGQREAEPGRQRHESRQEIDELEPQQGDRNPRDHEREPSEVSRPESGARYGLFDDEAAHLFG
jgi:hypothetical protein